MDKIKAVLGSAVGICTTLFIVVYLSAWACNALNGSKFDLPALQSMYLSVVLPLLVKHGTDSVFNSARDKMP